MGAGHLLGVEPPVIAGGELEGQLVVLVVIFPHINVKTVAADIMIRPAGDFLFFRVAFSPDVAAFRQLFLNLCQVLFVKRNIQGGGNRFQMVDFCLHLYG